MELNDNSGPNLMPVGEPPSKAGLRILESFDPLPVVMRVFVFCVLVYCIIGSLSTLAVLTRLLNASTDSTTALFYSECLRAAGTLIAAWVMARIEGRRLGEYGLPRIAGQGKLAFLGAAFGIAEISGIVGVLAATGYYSFGSLEIHGATLVKWALFWAALFTVVAFFEEYAFRGYAQFALTKGFGFWTASIVTSLIFGAVHLMNPGESWPGIAGVVAVGIFWCFTLRRTGSLWFALGMHAAFDFGETFLFSVPDSGTIFPGHLSSAAIHKGPVWLVGGTAGPEASILDFVILAIFFYVVHRMYPAMPESWEPELPPASTTSVVNPSGDFAVSIETPSVAGGENQRTSSDA